MLKPTSDRLDYASILSPPAGYQVVCAVGTTYSLDFDALIGICIALGLAESTDSELLNSPVYLLEALRRTSDKVILFCESGQIYAPSKYSSLFILLEKMVYQVAVRTQSHQPKTPSFHSKFWLIKYESLSGDILYRTIVLSRNLTFDRSWDVSVCLEGKPGRRDQRSVPISNFLKYLKYHLKGKGENVSNQRRIVNGLAKEITGVSFEIANKAFSDFEFIPVGVNDEDGNRYDLKKYPLFSESYHELFVMTPFFSSGIISEINDRKGNIQDPQRILITRRESLNKLKYNQCDKIQIYTMKDMIVDGEAALSENSAGYMRQDIHAKIYLWRKYSNTELYLGSLNASHSALNGNIEMMLRLKGKNRYLNMQKLTEDLFGGNPEDPDNPFERTELPNVLEEENDLETDLQRQIKELTRQKINAHVQDDDGRYNIIICFSNFIETTTMTISPMLFNKPSVIQKEVSFFDLNELQVSHFYRVTARSDNTEVSRVMIIPTDNMPETREKSVFSSIVRDSKSFVQYVAFLLGDNFLLSLIENTTLSQSGFYGDGLAMKTPALYERMLKTAARSPEKFKEIDYLLNMLSNSDVIPDGFIDLYNTFRKALNNGR